MNDRPHLSDEDLHASIDGELDSARMAEVTALIQGDAELTRRVAAYRADNERIVQTYGPLIEQPLPAAWLTMIERRQRTPAVSRAVMAIAASVALMIGGLAIYPRLMPSTGESIVAEALDVYGAARQTPSTAAPSDPSGAMTAALGLPLKAPDLSKMGYVLAAMRIYADAPAGKAIRLDYRDGQNRLLTLYVKRSPGPERFDIVKRGAVRICVWQDDVLSTIMLGEISAGEMLRLATLAYADINA